MAAEFDSARLARELVAPRTNSAPFSWSLEQIYDARNQQMMGVFRQPVRMAEAMRTDDAMAVAYESRLAPQRCIRVAIEPGKGPKAVQVAGEAAALFGEGGIGLSPNSRSDIHGTLVNHGVAVGLVQHVPREDGSRVDLIASAWPLEFVRWDATKRGLFTQVEGGPDERIVHGDGRWIVFQKHDLEPWKQEACVLPGCLVWARHAFAIRDWARGSVAHGNAKVIGELPEGLALQDADGNPSQEGVAFIELLKAIGSSDSPVGIRPAGSTVDYLVNGSTAWQVFNELVLNGEKAAARIYLGTDGILGSQGGAPGVDIQALFGVAATRVEGDLRAIERGMQSGLVDVWTAINFGDSTLAPKWVYEIPDGDESARAASYATRKQAFYADIAEARANGFQVTQLFVDSVAARHGIEAPTLVEKTASAQPVNEE